MAGSPFATAASNPSVADWVKKDSRNEQPSEAVPVEEPEERSLFSVIAALLFYTLVIVGLIYGLIKFLASRQQAHPANKVIRILGASSVGQQKSVQVVQVGDQVLVVGVGQDVSLLAEITDEQQKQQLLAYKQTTVQKGGFQELFQSSLEKQKERLIQTKNQWAERNRESDR